MKNSVERFDIVEFRGSCLESGERRIGGVMHFEIVERGLPADADDRSRLGLHEMQFEQGG